MTVSTCSVCLLLPVVLSAVGSVQAHAPGWVKHDGNPVLSSGEGGEWDDLAISPGAAVYDGSTYRLWYKSCLPITAPLGIGRAEAPCTICQATSADGLVWARHPGILFPGGEGAWDCLDVGDPSVVFDGETYTMWYSAVDCSGGGYVHAIGMATSADGVSWTKYAGNPVLTAGEAGDWDETGVSSPSVAFEGESYKMWYAGTSSGAIGFATSPDGVSWTKHAGNPVLESGEAGALAESISAMAVVFDGVLYHGLYTGRKVGGSERRIGYASSPDGVVWTKGGGCGGHALMPGRLTTHWDRGVVAYPAVLVVNGQVKMYYLSWSEDYETKGIGLATTRIDRLLTCSYWLAIAANQTGAFGSLWLTDLVTRNLSDTEAEIQLVFHSSDGDISVDNTITASGQGVFPDVVGAMGSTGKGSLEVHSHQPLAVLGRIYSQAEEGTYGQFCDGFSPADGLQGHQSGWLYGLRQVEGRYRTNISLTNTSYWGQARALVTVYLYRNDGTEVARFAQFVRAGEVVHELEPFANRAGEPNLGWGFAKVEVIGGGGVLASASVVDSATNDATTVPMKR